MLHSHQMLNLPHKIRANTTRSVSETLDPHIHCCAHLYSVASHVPLPSFKLVDPIEDSVQWTDDQRRSKFQVFWQQYRVEEGHHLQVKALKRDNRKWRTAYNVWRGELKMNAADISYVDYLQSLSQAHAVCQYTPWPVRGVGLLHRLTAAVPHELDSWTRGAKTQTCVSVMEKSCVGQLRTGSVSDHFKCVVQKDKRKATQCSD